MKIYKLVLFKSPTCGPCKMFQPQLEKAVSEFNNSHNDKSVELELCDVSTEEGLVKASSLGISSSGEAILFDLEGKSLIQWHRPHSCVDILKDLTVLD